MNDSRLKYPKDGMTIFGIMHDGILSKGKVKMLSKPAMVFENGLVKYLRERGKKQNRHYGTEYGPVFFRYPKPDEKLTYDEQDN